MGGSVVFYGFCVILVVILGSKHEVSGSPVPVPEICIYRTHHHHHHLDHIDAPTTAAPATPTPEQKAAEERKQKFEQFKKLVSEFLGWDKEAEKKPEEKKEPEKKKEEPKGFANMDDFFSNYIAFLWKLYYSW